MPQIRIQQTGLILSLLLAAFSQYLLLKNPETPAWALMGYAAAAVIFVWVSWTTPGEGKESAFSAVPLQRTGKGSRIAAGLLAASFGISLFTVLNMDHDNTGPGDYGLIAAWWASILLYASAILVLAQWHWPDRIRILAWWRANWLEILLLMCLAAAAFSARFIDLAWLPYAMRNDEGQVGLSAFKILSGEDSNFFTTSWAAEPVWSFVPNAIAISLLGNSLTALRLVSVLTGALSVVSLYLLAREAFGRETAFLAAPGLAGLAWHIHFSRLAVHNIVDSLTSATALWLIYRALRRGQATDFLWAGLITGLAIYTYVGSRLVFLLIPGVLAFSWLRGSVRLRTQWAHFLVFAGAAAVMAGPMVAYFLYHYELFMARMNDVGLLANGGLERLAGEMGTSIPGVLLSQISKSTLVYVAEPANAQFFNSPRPYFPAVASVFLILGLAYATWRAREPRYFAVLLWFWMVVILGSTLTYGPPSHQRMLMAAPAAALLAAIGLWQAAGLAGRLGMLPYKAGLALCIIIMGVSSAQGIAHYFGEYRAGHYSEDPAEEYSHEVTLALKALGPDYRLAVIGAPLLNVKGHANFGYLAKGYDQMDFDTVRAESLAALPLDKGILFTAIPMRVNDLKKVAQWLPGGEWMDVPRRYQPDDILYHAYRVSPETAAAARANQTAPVDPYQDVVDSPDGRFSAKLRVNWADPNEKPAIEIRDSTGLLVREIEYQFPEVSWLSLLAIYGWSPDSSKVFFYYPFWYEGWYTIFKGSHLQSFDPYTGRIEDVVEGCCIDFDFSDDMSLLAYTSETKVGVKDLKSDVDKSADILPHSFSQSGRIYLSPGGEKVIFHTLDGHLGTTLFLDVNTMEQKIILKDYLMMEYEFDGWTSEENPRFRKADKVFVIDLDTLEQTILETPSP
jgi:4-amino-4-deoxy-L-arabinose transferase-like glycosyltransferase